MSSLAINNIKIISYNTALERTMQSQREWAEFLRKLREGGGGGGGGSRRYDKIAMSMKWINFLSGKLIQNLMQNAKMLPLLTHTNTIQTKNINQSYSLNLIQKAGFFLSKGLSNIISLLARNNLLINTQKTFLLISKEFNEILQIVSFQLNKLKEVLEQELKEARKMDIREKIKEGTKLIIDFFVKLTENILKA